MYVFGIFLASQANEQEFGNSVSFLSFVLTWIFETGIAFLEAVRATSIVSESRTQPS